MKKLFALLLALTLALSLAACGKQTQPAEEPADPPVEEEVPENEGDEMMTDSEMLPVFSDEITTKPSETEKLPELEELIAKTWGIPQESYEETAYYYNYVDLNDDGVDEIFAVAIGMYTSGTGGDSALIAAQINGKLELNQTLTLVREPIIISDKMTNGCHEIIVPYYGGGAEDSGYQILTCSDGAYANVSDGTFVETLDDVAGTAIIYNDLAADMQAESMLHLG